MSYLTYNKEFQYKVINSKLNGEKVKDICKEYSISVYTLYKILHMNGKMPTPSEALEGKDSKERVEHRSLSPNNNNSHERPASTWKNYGDCHKKIKHVCFNCNEVFYVRDRGTRTKFCHKSCQGKHKTEQNSIEKRCDFCGTIFSVKTSAINCYVHCKKCRGKNLGRPSSKMSRRLGKWLESVFIVEKEKSFDWFYNVNKPKGRFRLDYFLPTCNIAIEYDGEQHFKPCFTSRWETVDKVRKRDLLKEKLCNDYGIKTIRFRYDEPLSKEFVLMKIYAELQGNEPVEVHDKKLVR